MFIILGTQFHLNYLIIKMIVPGTPIPFLSHSLLFVNLIPTYIIQIFHSFKLFINFMPIVSFHSNYFPLFIVSCPLSLVHLFHSNSHQIVSGTPIPFLSHSLLFINLMSIVSYTYSMQVISFSFINQSHVHYPWYTIPFKLSHYQNDCLWNTHSILISFSSFINLMPTYSI